VAEREGGGGYRGKGGGGGVGMGRGGRGGGQGNENEGVAGGSWREDPVGGAPKRGREGEMGERWRVDGTKRGQINLSQKLRENRKRDFGKVATETLGDPGTGTIRSFAWDLCLGPDIGI